MFQVTAAPVGHRLSGEIVFPQQRLIETEPRLAEVIRRSRQIQAPRAISAVSDDGDSLGGLCFEPMQPLAGCAGVILSEIVHRTHLEACAFYTTENRANGLKLTIGKDVDVGKRRLVGQWPIPGPPNSRKDEHPIGPEHVEGPMKILGQPGLAYMLDHSNAGELVAAAQPAEVAIIKPPDFALVRQTFGVNAALGKVGLRITNGDSNSAYTIFASGVNNEAAPSASDIDECFSRPKFQLCAYLIHSLHLGSIEIICRVLETRTSKPCFDQAIADRNHLKHRSGN
jgi:hypothetical protein